MMKYITDDNPDWPGRFKQIALRASRFLPAHCRVHHVGSTSIPGMPAKDIIDLVIECPNGLMPEIVKALVKAGYEHEGDKGIAGREAFRPCFGSEAERLPAHHLYACEAGAQELRKQLAFRDYLRANPERARWLAEKKRAVDGAAGSRVGYIEKKAEFYSVITMESLEWANAAAKGT
jgi:GrpB-like predicted nucleotidyltransferase (UPF0157 family)